MSAAPALADAPPPRVPGKLEQLYLKRDARDRELAAQPGGHPRGLWFDDAAADRAVQFVEKYCRHWEAEWAGKPLLLDPWQRGLVRVLFGWYRSDGHGPGNRIGASRRFRVAAIVIPRKNGKTTLAAAIALYLLVADGEPGAQVYFTATKEDQAAIGWTTAAQMVKASPSLSKFVQINPKDFLKPRGGAKILSVPRSNSRCRPLGADSKTLDGLNDHGHVSDELQEQRSAGVWVIIQTSQAARRQPLTVGIMTAGVYDPEQIGWQLYDKACKVLEGTLQDDALLAFIASMDEGDDPFSEAAQRKANPGYGTSVKPGYLREQADEAKRNPAYLNEYLRLHMNVWTHQVTRWIPPDRWAECEPTIRAGESPDRAAAEAREASLEKRECFGGLDLSSTQDLTAFVLEFPDPDGQIHSICRFWLPRATVVDYSRRGLKHYEQWERDGWLRVTEGEIIDYKAVRAEINALAKRYVIKRIGFDKYNSTEIITNLEEDGLECVEVNQSFVGMSAASKDFLGRVVDRKVRHGGNPILRFCSGNAVVSTNDEGHIKPSKKMATGKIDGIVAHIIAHTFVIGKPVAPQGSYLLNADMVVLG